MGLFVELLSPWDQEPIMQLKTLPIFLAFFLMGLADAMGPNSDKIKEAYKAEKLTDFTSTLPTFAVFIAFAVFSVPGGLLAARIGKKNLLLLGLALNAAALLIPSFVIHPDYNILLVCIFALGIGTTFLQVAGNPIMRDVSAEGNYSRNLAFAQGIKGIGSTASTFLLAAIATIPLFAKLEWQAGFPFFCALMALAFVGVAPLRIKEAKADVPPSVGSSLSLLKEPVFLLAVIGIFVYVGAEASMARFLKPALMQLGMNEESANTWGPTMFFLIFTVGRLLGGPSLSFMSPRACFRLSAALGLLGVITIMISLALQTSAAEYSVGHAVLGLAGLAVAALGFANVWSMLFSITVEEKPGRASELSGLMCMAISGGAIVPLLMGLLRTSIATKAGDQMVVTPQAEAFSFIVPAACFAYLLTLSLLGELKPATPGAAA
jgi:FHS family L-fucose permease-like MFS transporter